MSTLTPAEDGEMFTKAAAYVASLDEIEIVEFLMEVQMHSPNIEKMIEIRLATEHVMEGWKDIHQEKVCS